MRVSHAFLVSLPLCLFGVAVALAQSVRPEFRVNTYTTHVQRGPSIASDATGNLVVVWRSLWPAARAVKGGRTT
jgi:hypothetical protein